MTVLPRFPDLPGLGYSTYKRPTFSTRVAAARSGREVRRSDYANPLFEYELTFDALNAGWRHQGLGLQSLQTLMGFYLDRAGQLRPFLYRDKSDWHVDGQVIGAGNGGRTRFTFCRQLGSYYGPVGAVDASGVNVYVAGSLLGAGAWSIEPPNSLVLAAAPAVGHQVSADFSYDWICRFLDDKHEYEQIMHEVWTLKSCKFRTIR